MRTYEYIATPSEFARSHLFYALIGGFEATSPQFIYERKHYPAYEVLLVMEGRGFFRHGSEWKQLVEGDLLLHNMRYPHAYRSDPTSPFQMLYLVYDGYGQEELWKSFFDMIYVILPSGSKRERFSSSLEHILKTIKAEDPQHELEISSCIYQLQVEALDLFHRGAHKKISKIPASIEAARHYMDQHYLTISTIEEVSNQVAISHFHFIRQYKRYYGCTPYEYIMLKKINHAKRRLLLTADPITEISYQSGFENYNTFLHSFLKSEQCSPSVYRKTWKRREAADLGQK